MTKKTEPQENLNTSTELVKIESTEESPLETALVRLTSLAISTTGELGEKVALLAQLTKPNVKGIEGEQRMVVPSIYLRQKMSSSAIMPLATKVGGMFDSNGGCLPDELEFVPILGHALRQKWTEDNRIDCQSLDGEKGNKYGKCSACPYGRFEKDKKTECSLGSRFFIVTADLSTLYRVNFLKTSAGAGKNIYRLTVPPALWARTFVLATEKKSSNSKDFFTFVVRASGKKTEKAVMEVCDALYDVFHASFEEAKAVLSADVIAADTSADVTVHVADGESDTIDFSDAI